MESILAESWIIIVCREQCSNRSRKFTRGVSSRHGRRLRVTYVTQVEEELEDLPDDLDDLVPQRLLGVEDEHVGGVAGPVGLSQLAPPPSICTLFGGAQD